MLQMKIKKEISRQSSINLTDDDSDVTIDGLGWY